MTNTIQTLIQKYIRMQPISLIYDKKIIVIIQSN